MSLFGILDVYWLELGVISLFWGLKKKGDGLRRVIWSQIENIKILSINRVGSGLLWVGFY